MLFKYSFVFGNVAIIIPGILFCLLEIQGDLLGDICSHIQFRVYMTIG